MTYPTIDLLVGVDISSTMVAYAREKAASLHLSDRVQFQKMDALLMLEFPPEFFDLVNQRFGVSYLRTWDWPKLLKEYRRVARSGGIVRITESNIPTSNSEALTRFCQKLTQTFYQAGHLFEAAPDGLQTHLAPLLTKHGLMQVQTHLYSLNYHPGTPEGDAFIEDGRRLLANLKDFVQKWTKTDSAEYAEIARQSLEEMQKRSFWAEIRLITAWGSV